jgi:hypothetical protein
MLVKFTGLDGEDLYINPVNVLMVGQAVGQKPSTIAPGTMISEVVGTLIGVPGVSIAVKEDRALVVAVINDNS